MNAKINSAALALIFSFLIVLKTASLVTPIKNYIIAFLYFLFCIAIIIFLSVILYKIFEKIVNIYSGFNFKGKEFCSKLITYTVNIMGILIAILINF